MRAEIVSVGTELLLGQITDTNAVYAAKAFSAVGIGVYRRITVGDNMERLVAALRQALSESDIVLTIGGLGPTMDDITREGLADAFGDTLHRDESVAQKLRDLFALRSIPLTPALMENNLRQAMVPVRGRALDNPNGTAPGLYFEGEGAMAGKIGFALPGPPNEFIPLLENHVMPLLRAKTGNVGTIRSLVLRVAGMGESAIEEKVKDMMLDANPSVAPYAKVGEVHLRVTARADSADEADRLIRERADLVKARLGDVIYGEDDNTLEQVVVNLLKTRNQTVATAESCTGGLVAQRITDVAGSSSVFPGGVIAYSNAAKTDLVAVPADLIARVGAVSPDVAQALAEGARRRFGATYGIGITGIAGPDGGTPEKPVGLVYICVSYSGSSDVEKANFIGSRQIVRTRSAQTALNMLRLRVLQTP